MPLRGNAGNGDEDDLNALRCALGIHSGKIILNSAMPDSLRAVRHCIFTGGVVEGNGIASFSGLALSVSSLRSLPPLPKGEALALRYSFRLKCKASGRARSPGGSCRAATEGAINRRSRKKRLKDLHAEQA